ncbi:MAG: hypothetical protein Q9M13_03330, partial [Mariprofundales bacterium]|nr:hypothetical protein [Mariprofundales bacterium]
VAMAGRVEPIVVVEKMVRKLLAQAQDLVVSIQKPKMVSDANDLLTLIQNTPSGEFVGSSSLTREEWLDISALMNAFMTWMNTPLAEANGQTPVMIAMKYAGLAAEQEV